MSQVACEEHVILRGRFRADLRVYIDSAVRLERATGEEFDGIYKDAEYARLAFERSRATLSSHITVHDCEVQWSAPGIDLGLTTATSQQTYTPT
jgi:hypothetical protein